MTTAKLPFDDVLSSFIVQDTWDDEDDIELLEYLRSLPQSVQRLSKDKILKLGNTPTPRTMIFCDSCIIQKLLNAPAHIIVPSYPSELARFYRRKISLSKLGQVPFVNSSYFVKLAGSDKTVPARVIHNEKDDLKLRSELSNETLVYASDVVDFVSEWRLFLSPNRLWGCQEYSEYMVGHRLLNHNADDNGTGGRPLVIQDIKHVPEDFCNAVRESAKPLGFVVVDVGLTSAGKWCVVECNPPFALSSYELDIGVYVDYCVAAWQGILAKRSRKQEESETGVDETT